MAEELIQAIKDDIEQNVGPLNKLTLIHAVLGYLVIGGGLVFCMVLLDKLITHLS